MAAFKAAGSSVVGSDGKARVTVGPERANERWEVLSYAIQLRGSAVGLCYVYENSEADTNLIDSTYDGVNNSSDAPAGLVMSASERLYFVWESATPGATATAIVRYSSVS